VKNYEVLSNDELLEMYKKINEYIKTLESSKKEILETETKDVS